MRGFERQPAFLTHSTVNAWLEKMNRDFLTMEMTLEDALLRMPDRMSDILPWIDDTCLLYTSDAADES